MFTLSLSFVGVLLGSGAQQIAGHAMDHQGKKAPSHLPSFGLEVDVDVEAEAEAKVGALTRRDSQTTSGPDGGLHGTPDSSENPRAGRDWANFEVFAAGIAHEINTPLFLIKTNSYRLQKLTSKEGPLNREQLTQISTALAAASERVGEIVRSLMGIAKTSSEEQRYPVSVCQILQQVLLLSAVQLRHRGVRFTVDSPEAGVTINCRPAEVAQAIMNLLSNSLDAVAGLPDPWIALEVKTDKEHVEIAVIDCGRGVAAEHRSKIMRPFFSTKEGDLGSGLGLSVCWAIARDLGGELAYDETSEQTKFILKLPRGDEVS